MTTPSNLYAEKIFAEHPTAFWAMDGEADYLSLITELQRKISSYWTASGGTASTIYDDLNQPFPESYTSKMGLSSVPGSPGQYTFTSENLFNLNELDSLFSSISCGMYYRILDDNIDYIDFGFQPEGGDESVIRVETPNKNGDWQFISKTINVSTATSKNIMLKIRVAYNDSTTQKAEIFINGLGVGVWSEEFLKTSLGQDAVTIPSEISSKIPVTKGVVCESYGGTGKTGFYVVEKKTIRARNTSIPMVYGAENSTSLLGYYSIVVPGQGFMHNIGRNQDRTLEFWLRKNSTGQKILGPISNSDGLYEIEGSLLLKIGKYRKKYFVGELGRPMLVHIISQTNNYSILINGEKVLSLDVESELLDLPKNDPDWIGFYGKAEVDNIAFYSYVVPEVVAKRRFVYGQGVEYPLNVNSTYNGKSIFIDYRFAEYSNNYSYPNIGRWRQGTYDNVIPLDNALSLPTYPLPTFRVRPPEELDPPSQTAQEWLDYHAVGGSHMSGLLEFEPSGFDSSGESTEPQIYIEKLSSILTERAESITMSVYLNDSTPPAADRLLLKVLNRKINKSISIFLEQSNRIVCKIMSGSTVDETIQIAAAPVDPYTSTILFGFDVTKISAHSTTASLIFENQDDCSVYIGSDENFNSFCGDIWLSSFGISTKTNTVKHFSSLSNGIIFSSDPGTSVQDGLARHNNYASYRLTTTSTDVADVSRTAIPDIQVTGYWEDYVPLSVLAKEVFTDSENAQKTTDIDFVQFNIDSTGVEDAWVSFQYLSEGANKPQAQLTTRSWSGVVLPDVSGWEDARFAVSDGSIIYIPKEEDGSGQDVELDRLAMVIHIEVKNVGVLYNPDIKIKSLQISSQALNHNSTNSVNTIFSEKIYPTVVGGTKPHKAQNPFRIYKSSTPYLYLASNTGIELAGYGMSTLDLGGGSNRSLKIILTKSPSGGNLSSIQMAIRYTHLDTFPSSETKIFELDTESGLFSFYVERSTAKGERGRIFAKKDGAEYFYDASGNQVIEYHLNGKKVRNPVITTGEWAMIAVTFPNPLTLNQTSSLDLTGPLLFNNISYYQVDPNKLDDQISYSSWSDVDDATWEDVGKVTWQDNLISSESAIVSIDPSIAYSVYLGTNKIIVDTHDSSSPTLKATNYEYVVYKDIKWQSQTILPT
jgi:hypothetical protein